MAYCFACGITPAEKGKRRCSVCERFGGGGFSGKPVSNFSADIKRKTDAYKPMHGRNRVRIYNRKKGIKKDSGKGWFESAGW